MTETLDAALSHTRGETDTPLIEQTIGDNLDATVETYADHEALVDIESGRRWTYGEFLADVETLAAGLLEAGVEKGDRVGIWAPNCPEWTLTQYATAKIGAVLVNINPAYRSHELKYVLEQAGISTLISMPNFKTSNYARIIEQVKDECEQLARIVFIGERAWDELFAAGRDAGERGVAAVREIQAGLDNGEAINIQYTSGTTGFPKGATLSHRNILNNGFFVGELCSYTADDRVCIPVPFYHCFGMVMGNLACTTHGAAMIIPAPGFDPVISLRTVEAERCTSLYGVPTMFIAELALDNFDEFDLTSLRTGIMAGSPCPEHTMRQVMEKLHMEEVSICYGMTETSPVSLQTRKNDTVAQRTQTVGRVGPHLEVSIVDPVTNEVVGRGEPGELCTKGYSVMLGYWEADDKTAGAIVDGWMHTGDLGVMDEDGYVAITGRIKDMVIRGGENIYPREIEEFLYNHPDIVDAQVIGVPDERFGEELMACVRLRDGAEELTAESLREYCSGKLAHYKVPRYVRVMDEFPMTVTGKIRKIELREQASEYMK
ncbi:AMP-binding protein [Dermacoccus sp. Tok2021]|uniref:AMP-binding protein n=1 Tax=Dermacoccus sp. Tok2021 TaxID=2826873 RepID=UPI001CA618D6|nr:AMP-binding protein [Dermacoccus sp. Tok2021]MBZ4497660.1 AMP-binding protein [Dermacoccus sp. Tok2021]